tara:strand:- start:22518 stop:23096 length:579 start_codon:yes stop_codon:yes gene_type:complete
MIKKFHIYFITEKLDELNLDYVKKIGAILILRNANRFKRNDLKKFNNRCKKRNINLFIPNDIKILFFLKSNKFYVSAYNKKHFKHLKKIKPNIEIIGSAHNVAEINEKIRQGCDFIVLSRIFETSNKFKKGHFGTTKFNLLTRNFSKKFIALGGINEKNFRKINILNIRGCALLKDKKKAGKYMPAFLKNNF